MAIHHAESWFHTLDFATLYATATRALVTCGGQGGTRVAFYSIDHYLGMFRRIRFVAPINLSDDVLRRLMDEHKVQFVSIPFIGLETLDESISGILRRKAVRHAEDAVIQLPATVNEYLAGLGRKTRKHLPYYVRRVEREWGPRLQYLNLANEDIKIEHFECLVHLNQMRMLHKGTRSGWTEQMVKTRWSLARNAGLFTGICFDNRLVAGTLCYLYRGDAYLVLIAHDPAYDSLNLGNGCLFRTIDRLIQLRYARLHLLWGQSFYKRQFGGDDEPLFEVTVFGASVYAMPIWQAVSAFRTCSTHAKRILRPAVRKLRVAVQPW
jgi:CelD/BcsL family acetyltransferase involved in cellulose biosynthesis